MMHTLRHMLMKYQNQNDLETVGGEAWFTQSLNVTDKSVCSQISRHGMFKIVWN